MKASVECGTCLTHWIYGRSSAGLPEGSKLALLEEVVHEMTRSLDPDQNLGRISNGCTDAAFQRVPGARGQYRDAKHASNRGAQALVPEAARWVDRGATPREKLARACSVAALANIAPLGVPTGPFAFDELRSLLDRGKPEPVFAGDPYDAAQRARDVLYVADNAGEVVLDTLLMRLLKSWGARITLVVKHPDFFEDATLDDVEELGLKDVADEVLHLDGFLAPATAPEAVGRALARSDLVIAKGTGAFEALHGELGGRPGIFLLKVKCRPISRLLGITEGHFAVAVTG